MPFNSNNFPPDINPQVYSFIAVLIGSACVGDYNAAEQNSLGNWLILIGQFILTSAAQQQLIEGRIENSNININSKEAKMGSKSNQNQRPEVEFLLDAIKKIEKELNELKNKD